MLVYVADGQLVGSFTFLNRKSFFPPWSVRQND